MSSVSLKDYGIIGNKGHAALVDRFGGIDWCCFPEIDSPSHFGALEYGPNGGRFQIIPHGEYHSEQHYLQRTQILETAFETPYGRARLTDWMPIETVPVIHRRIEVVQGRVQFFLSCAPRFESGNDIPGAEYQNGEVVFRGRNPSSIARLASNIPLELVGERGPSAARASFTLETGQSAIFRWSWGFSRRDLITPVSEIHPRPAIDAWRSWAHHCIPAGCPFAGPWHDTVVRSSMLLHILSDPETGAIAEGLTDEARYANIRDGAWALQAMTNLGYREECQAWFQWLYDLLARDGAEGLEAAYKLNGGHKSREKSRFHLSLYGHVMLAATEYYNCFGRLPTGLWPRLSSIADFAGQAWRRPDAGFDEVNPKPDHFTASKLYCWVALDRAIQLAHSIKVRTPARWGQERDILHRTLCEQGFDESIGSFTRAFGDSTLDAAVLLMPILGFLPMDDARMAGTVSTIQTELSEGVLLRRSSGDKDANLLASLWLVQCLALGGHVSDASDRLAEICSYATPLGIFGENVDRTSGETTGHFPAIQVHLALINAALYVGAARGRRIPSGTLLGKTA
ncbi:MAG: glycoside hydrolase family 15 protein [Oligoflexia bacterium]|nr:glycoside hydrolase family 15 protein [Oligoflexia bacterium]